MSNSLPEVIWGLVELMSCGREIVGRLRSGVRMDSVRPKRVLNARRRPISSDWSCSSSMASSSVTAGSGGADGRVSLTMETRLDANGLLTVLLVAPEPVENVVCSDEAVDGLAVAVLDLLMLTCFARAR